VQYSGTLVMIDVQAESAIMAFKGTYTSAAPEDNGSSDGAQTGEPLTLIHRLSHVDSGWRIVDELATTDGVGADGAEHVRGCN
jgi:hypothetical protein